MAEEYKNSRRKPSEIYSIIENFCLGVRRLELFGNDQSMRPGWVTVGPEVTRSTFELQSYLRSFDIGGRVLPFHAGTYVI